MPRLRVLLLGATGTIGQATLQALLAKGYEVICVLRTRKLPLSVDSQDIFTTYPFLSGATVYFTDLTNENALREQCLALPPINVIVSCLASRTGLPKDAWQVDYQIHCHLLNCAKSMGVGHFVLLSAICVQRPQLAFQQAKLAFEKQLIESNLKYSIVRPTAFFKSLSGQVHRVMQGKSFLLFGNGELTACKPISDRDLGRFIANCIDHSEYHDQVLPIGGPTPPITPKQQGEKLFELLGKPPQFRQVPVGFMDMIIHLLSVLSWLFPRLKDKAELAKIGRYYATESMLVLNPTTGKYDASLTPSFGSDTLFDYYQELITNQTIVDLGDHAIFK